MSETTDPRRAWELALAQAVGLPTLGQAPQLAALWLAGANLSSVGAALLHATADAVNRLCLPLSEGSNASTIPASYPQVESAQRALEPFRELMLWLLGEMKRMGCARTPEQQAAISAAMALHQGGYFFPDPSLWEGARGVLHEMFEPDESTEPVPLEVIIARGSLANRLESALDATMLAGWATVLATSLMANMRALPTEPRTPFQAAFLLAPVFPTSRTALETTSAGQASTPVTVSPAGVLTVETDLRLAWQKKPLFEGEVPAVEVACAATAQALNLTAKAITAAHKIDHLEDTWAVRKVTGWWYGDIALARAEEFAAKETRAWLAQLATAFSALGKEEGLITQARRNLLPGS